ncbi:MAG TPA: CBS domain-containing protein [Actinomycetota bacterium]|nr:CBS domain-containing protein [Actinomycetota bacterium]
MTEVVQVSAAASGLVRRYIDAHPVDAARVMEKYPGELSSAVLRDVPLDRLAPVIAAMSDHAAAECVAAMEPARAAAVLEVLDLDQAAALLRRTAEPERDRILDLMPADQAAQLRRVLAFPPGSAGALMDPKVLSVPESLTAAEALEYVRAAPHLAIYYLYIYDDETSRLSGVVNLRELMLAEPRTPLTEIMATSVDRLSAGADRQAILVHPGWAEYHSLPVVDDGGRFVGALRYETLRRLEGQARTEVPSASLAASLGELYWVGLSGILRGMGHVVTPEPLKRTGEDRDAG